jgi:hypothetical protein
MSMAQAPSSLAASAPHCQCSPVGKNQRHFDFAASVPFNIGGSSTLEVRGLLGGTPVGTDHYNTSNTSVSDPTYANWTTEFASVLAGKTLSELDISLDGKCPASLPPRAFLRCTASRATSHFKQPSQDVDGMVGPARPPSRPAPCRPLVRLCAGLRRPSRNSLYLSYLSVASRITGGEREVAGGAPSRNRTSTLAESDFEAETKESRSVAPVLGNPRKFRCRPAGGISCRLVP